MDVLQAAEEMLSQLDSVQLSSMTDEGYPRICEMEVTARDGLREFFFTTKRGSNKVRHYQSNPKAGIGFCVGDNCASLVGDVEVAEDSALLGKRDSAQWCILRFQTIGGKVFIDGSFSEFSYE